MHPAEENTNSQKEDNGRIRSAAFGEGSIVGGYVGAALGLALGLVVGLYVGIDRGVDREKFNALDDVVLPDALSKEPARTLLGKKLLTREQVYAAAEAGVKDLVNSANAEFSKVSGAEQAAKAAIEAYLRDKTKAPVIAVPNAAP